MVVLPGAAALEISTRIRCPRWNTTAVGGRTISALITRSPFALTTTSFAQWVRNGFASVVVNTASAAPLGCTSANLTMKSVDGADVLTYRTAANGPVTSTGSRKTSLV